MFMVFEESCDHKSCVSDSQINKPCLKKKVAENWNKITQMITNEDRGQLEKTIKKIYRHREDSLIRDSTARLIKKKYFSKLHTPMAALEKMGFSPRKKSNFQSLESQAQQSIDLLGRKGSKATASLTLKTRSPLKSSRRNVPCKVKTLENPVKKNSAYVDPSSRHDTLEDNDIIGKIPQMREELREKVQQKKQVQNKRIKSAKVSSMSFKRQNIKSNDINAIQSSEENVSDPRQLKKHESKFITKIYNQINGPKLKKTLIVRPKSTGKAQLSGDQDAEMQSAANLKVTIQASQPVKI
jgi:hypothetical protein